MGRRSLDKNRKKNKDKTLVWLHTLYPYFQEHGLKGITMDQVAKVLDKSKTTVYEYFRSKEELLEIMVGYKLKEIKALEGVLQDDTQTFHHRLQQVVQQLAEILKDVSTIFLSDLKTLHPEVWEKIEAFLHYAETLMCEFYQKGMAAGVFNQVNPAILTMSDTFFFHALADPAFLERERLTLQEAFKQYLQLKFYGLLRHPEVE